MTSYVEGAVADAVGAHDHEGHDDPEEDAIGNLQDLDPDADQGQIEDQEDDVADVEAGDHPPGDIGVLLEEKRAGDEPVHHEGPHDHRDGGRGRDAQGEQRDEGPVGVGVVGRFGTRDPFDHAGAEPLRIFGDLLLGDVRQKRRGRIGHPRNEAEERFR